MVKFFTHNPERFCFVFLSARGVRGPRWRFLLEGS
jgi:hypothetical protein